MSGADETYNGWRNRETWAFSLHLNSEQGLQQWALQSIADAISADPEVTDYELGDHLIEAFEELIGETFSIENERMVRRDIGSWWRIDRVETGAEWRETLAETKETAR